MYQVIDEDHLDQHPDYRAAFKAMPKKAGEVHVVVRLEPDAATSGGNGWEWLSTFHHDVNGALRSFNYLADKARASYAEGDPRGAKVLQAIDKHLKTFETLKHELIDRVLPMEK